jgi:hypothetical protein
MLFRTPPTALTGRTIRHAAAASLIALAGTAATAGTASAQGPAVPGGIALLPGGKHERLDFKAQPGSVVEGTVLVKNASRSSRTVKLSGVDVGTAEYGGAVYGETDGRKVGSWVHLGDETLTVPARTIRTVPFSVRVPAGARSGVHYAGITAADADQLRAAKTSDGAKKKSIVFHRIVRMALPVKLELPGPASPKLQLRDAKVQVNAVGTRATLELENTGGTLVRSTGVDLRITDGVKAIASSRQPMSEFVPGTKASYPLAITGVPKAGVYRIVGRVTPAGGPAVQVDEQIRITGKTVAKAKKSLQGAVEQRSGQGGISPVIWAAIGGLGLLAVGLGVAFARMRRRMRALTAAAAAPAAGAAGPQGGPGPHVAPAPQPGPAPQPAFAPQPASTPHPAPIAAPAPHAAPAATFAVTHDRR